MVPFLYSLQSKPITFLLQEKCFRAELLKIIAEYAPVTDPTLFIRNQELAPEPGAFWITDDNNSSLKFDEAGLNVSSQFKGFDMIPRQGLNSSTNNYNEHTNFQFSSIKQGAINFQRGPLMTINNTYIGPIGQTIWGVNSMFPARTALSLKQTVLLNNATYTISGSDHYPNGGIMNHVQFGSADNNVAVPLVMNYPANSRGGYFGNYVRMDLWPGTGIANDNGSSVKNINGWLNMCSSHLTMGAAAGSSIERVNYYIAGDHDLTNGNVAVANMVGLYIKTMKTASIVAAWGVLQEGVSDKNYFAGITLMGSAAVDTGQKLQVTGDIKTTGRLNLATAFTPTGSADVTGIVGDVSRDDNFLYIKTTTGWKRSALIAW